MSVATSPHRVAGMSILARRSAPLFARVADTSFPDHLDGAAGAVLRYGLTAMLLFFGAFKFTGVKAAGIQPLVSHSPFLSWLYSVASVRAVSNGIGVTEILVGLLIGARRFSASVSAIGSLLAVGLFATTVSFLVTTPGVFASVPGFPVPVPNEIGAFLVKDLFLLGAAAWSAAESLRAIRARY